MGVHIALLRGINVGGKHKLPMKDLRALFEAAGAGEVQTYIQSGNVVFESAAAEAKRIPTAVEAAIEKKFGFSSPVVVRSAAALRKVFAEHPFAADATELKLLMVAFLSKRPTAAAVKRLDAPRFHPDRFEVRGAEVFLHYPSGVARSKLTNAYLDRTLGTTSTVRNWKTVTKLVELCDAR